MGEGAAEGRESPIRATDASAAPAAPAASDTAPRAAEPQSPDSPSHRVNGEGAGVDDQPGTTAACPIDLTLDHDPEKRQKEPKKKPVLSETRTHDLWMAQLERSAKFPTGSGSSRWRLGV